METWIIWVTILTLSGVDLRDASRSLWRWSESLGRGVVRFVTQLRLASGLSSRWVQPSTVLVLCLAQLLPGSGQYGVGLGSSLNSQAKYEP